MLVNCPKCGFSQPKDRYCANCGVDMDLYRPKETPFWKKVLGNPLLHVLLIFVVVLTSILFIRQRQKEELRARVEYLKGGPVLVDREQKSQVEVSASTQAQMEIARENAQTHPPTAGASAASSAPSTEAGEMAAAANAPTVPPTGNDRLAAARLAENRPHKALILYAEVDRALLDQWSEEMRAAGQMRSFDSVTMGVLPHSLSKLKNTRGVKVLQQVEQALPTASGNQEWFVGTHRGPDVENEVGFFSSLSIVESKDGMIKGELEVQRAFRDPKDLNKTMERVSYGSPFELVSGSSYLMRGLLPRKFVADLPEDSNPDPFLSIFNSRSFASGQTEFTMILEFATSNNQNK